jgi:Na+/H+ antiporter NhaD/arsenite permease-like protein
VLAILDHAIVREYLPFMVLLGSLYVISGGIQLKGHLHAFPSVNMGFLAFGAIVANLIGTTGASMLLIRPLLQTNRDRRHVTHTVVFFIFLVSNIGGCLLPTGDPPLFLGFLSGVPFGWTWVLLRPWIFSVGVLLSVYYIWDRIAYQRESSTSLRLERRHASVPRLHGAINVVWLLAAVVSVAVLVPGRRFPGTRFLVGEHLRDGVLLVLSALSLATTPHGLRRESEYSNEAIAEVACLFVGIFVTMQVPIEILRARGGNLGLTTASHFFWTTGLLSSFLDNAPTYIVNLEAAKSLSHPAGAKIVGLLNGQVREDLLEAISLGAVFMGANTYIGNAPNLMVKLIAEQCRVPMPSFFGYMLYSGLILIPLFVLISLLFLP